MWDTIQKSRDRLEALRQLYPDHDIRITPFPWNYAQELSYLIEKIRLILLSDFHGIACVGGKYINSGTSFQHAIT